MKFRIAFPVVCVVASMLLVSCAATHKTSKQSKFKIDCSKKYERAMLAFNKGKFNSAKMQFDNIRVSCGSSVPLDSVTYFSARCSFNEGLYTEAKSEFIRAYQDFSASALADEARFWAAKSVYYSGLSVDRDQTETRASLRLFKDIAESASAGVWGDSAQVYLTKANEKLAQKEFEIAKFYQTIGEKEAAIVSFKLFEKEFPGSTFVADARVACASELIDLSRTDEASEELSSVLADSTITGLVRERAKLILAKTKQ